MRRNKGGYSFDEWTPTRKAKFVDWRLQGMHTHWAVFWTLINRRATRRGVYPAETVKKNMTTGEFPAELWRLPIGVDGRQHDLECMPPQELIDQLKED